MVDACSTVHSLREELDKVDSTNINEIEALFSTKLKPVTEYSYKSDRAYFKNLPIKNIEYPNFVKRRSFIAIELSSNERCIDRNELLDSFDNLELYETPRGHSIHEVTSWMSVSAKSEFSLGFKEKSPDCLGTITYEILKRSEVK